MNNLMFRELTHIFRSNTCEHGLGGLSMWNHAWRLISDHLLGKGNINLLSVVCIWVNAIQNCIPNESCLLSMDDSTITTG